MMKQWLNYVLAYLTWMIFTVLGVVFMLLSRQGFFSLLVILFVQGSSQRGKVAELIDRIYILAIGLLLLILVMVIESYFRHGVSKGNLGMRIGKVMGAEILLIFAAHLLVIATAGFDGLDLLQGLLMGIELLLGGSLFWLGIRKRPAEKKITRGELQ